MLLYEFKADLNKYLGALGPSARVHSLADVIAFNEKNRSREMPFFGQDLCCRRRRKGTTHRAGLPRRAEPQPAVLENGRDRRGDGQGNAASTR